MSKEIEKRCEMLEKKDLEMIAEIVGSVVDRKLQPVTEEIQQMKEDVNQVKEEINQVKEDVNQVKEEISQVKEDVNQVKEEINQVKEDVNQVKEDVRRVETTLENETNRGIQIIAEGHVDLRRKLNETLRMKEDDELIRIRVNRLERELNELKREIR